MMTERVHLSRLRLQVQVTHVPVSPEPESDAARDAASRLMHLGI